MDRLHLVVSGRVQGVSFRAHTQARARELGLTGIVRNLPDGRVEVWAEGPREALEGLLAFARTGPRYARVTDVSARWEVGTGEYGEFVVGR